MNDRNTNSTVLSFNYSGFTLLELMIVIAIIGVLAAIAIPNFISYRERAVHTAVLQEMRMIEKEIIVYNIANSRFPDDLEEIGLGSLEDPWGNPYQYLNIQNEIGPGNLRKDQSLVPVNTDFDLYSMGPDGKSRAPFTAKDSRDDIVRANDGAFFGRVSQY